MGVGSINWCNSKSSPHPSPLPEGEGTDWGIFESYTDLNVLLRIHNRYRCFRSMHSQRHRGRPPLSRRERGPNGGYWRATPT
ncbi:hypothetical protein PspCFBP13508_17035 [Pseudomonas sp. CFBP13508]|nr:hypothetical protein PspCFBP13508_17035 [Pseudomonas sp. CFBP13508]